MINHTSMFSQALTLFSPRVRHFKFLISEWITEDFLFFIYFHNFLRCVFIIPISDCMILSPSIIQ
jgi:hypothetical protein